MTPDKMGTSPEDRVLHDFMWRIIDNAYRFADESMQYARQEALDPDPRELLKRLRNLQIGAVLDVFSVLDGGSRPIGWPEIKLVNTATCVPLSNDLALAFSDVEDEYLDTLGSL